MNFKYLVISFILIIFQATTFAQSPFHLDKTVSKIIILGTSSVHDWEIEVTKFNCDASITTEENNQASVSGVHVTCEVKNVECENRIMTGKTYKALNGDDYPQITFNASETVTVSMNSEASIKGKLSIAGQTKDVVLPFKLSGENGTAFKIKGKIPVKMSDFKIEPPTAMMGALKTGNELEIEYDIVLQK